MLVHEQQPVRQLEHVALQILRLHSHISAGEKGEHGAQRLQRIRHHGVHGAPLLDHSEVHAQGQSTMFGYFSRPK